MKQNNKMKILTNITTIFLYTLFSIFILYCGNVGYVGIFQAKFNIFCLICGSYIGLMLLLAIELIIVGDIKFDAKKFIKSITIPQWFALLYMMLTWVSAIISPHFPETLLGLSRYEGAITISLYCLTFVLIASFGKITERMIYVFSIIVFLFDILCIAQLNGYNPFSLFPEGYDYYDAFKSYNGQFLGTLGNTDTVAAFLCIAIPLLWLSIVRLDEKKKWFIILPLLTSLYVVFKMWVLAGVLGIILGGIIILPFSLSLTGKQKKITIVGILSVLFVCLIGIYFSTTSNGLIYEIKELLHGDIDGSFGSGRIFIWQEVFQGTSNHIWFGSGPDTMIKANLQPFIRYDDTLQGSIVAQIDVAHNEYLNILFHQGIFALMAYILLIISVLTPWMRKGNNNRYIGILGGVIVCYLIQAFFGFSTCVVSPLLWTFLGLLAKEHQMEVQSYE